MAKAKKKKQDSAKLLYVIIGLLFLTVAVLATTLFMTPRPSATDRGVKVSLGGMEYSIVNNKAVKRTDASAQDLRAFLEQTAQKDIALGCTSAYYAVVRFTKDETQVLLNYGCDYPNARMFAVKEGVVWRLISPTNQFDDLGVPACGHVTENKISTDLSPVCVKDWDGGRPEYTIR